MFIFYFKDSFWAGMNPYLILKKNFGKFVKKFKSHLSFDQNDTMNRLVDQEWLKISNTLKNIKNIQKLKKKIIKKP